MTPTASDLSNLEARRIALAAQGFATTRPAQPVDASHILGVVNHVGLIQIDSVNVIVRAHYMPFFSRLGNYPRPLIDDVAYRQGCLFEQWAHEASFVPVEQYPLLRHRMAAFRPWSSFQKFGEEHPGYLDAILEEVSRRGPLTVSDLEDAGKRNGPWWGYSIGKIALEWHFGRGLLAVKDRRNFARVYDLTERVLPANILSTPAVSEEDAHREMLRLAARYHGIATAGDLVDYYRLRDRRIRASLDTPARLNELVEQGHLRRVTVEGWKQPAYMDARADVPPPIDARALLSPFDSLIWERERTERLFNFRYRIEIYTPEPKRQYGYYVMPFLLGEDLVARVDLKADRTAGALLAKAAYTEPGHDPVYVSAALAAELKLMANWLGLKRVMVGRKGDLADPLRRAVRAA